MCSHGSSRLLQRFSRFPRFRTRLHSRRCSRNIAMTADATGRWATCLAKLDVASLAGEHRFGNVRSCIVHRKQNMIRMYVSNGFMEVVAARASIDQR